MSAQRGNVYETRDGYGIRWREGGQRRYQSGLRTKTEARMWFRDEVAPRYTAARRAPRSRSTRSSSCSSSATRDGGRPHR
jgi:hypothetical protein